MCKIEIVSQNYQKLIKAGAPFMDKKLFAVWPVQKKSSGGPSRDACPKQKNSQFCLADSEQIL
jgi:hypothetical protein